MTGLTALQVGSVLSDAVAVVIRTAVMLCRGMPCQVWQGSSP